MLNLKSFEDYVTESAWGEMRKRSSGEVVRREDNIDLMDKDHFRRYLSVKYRASGSGWGVFDVSSTGHKDKLEVVIEKWKDDKYRYSYNLDIDYEDDMITKSNMRVYYKIDPLTTKNGWHYEPWTQKMKDYKEDAFFDEYIDAPKIFGDEYTIDKNKISPKSGELENHHIIDILDKCLSIVKKPYVKKIKNPKYYKEWMES